VRANARLKYLVHTLGVENFKKLVESYMGKKFSPWVPLPDWKLVDWMGWHPQGDGKLFLGVNIEQGRIIDRDGMKLKTFLRKVVDKYNTDIRLTPLQSVVIGGIDAKDKDAIDALMKEHGVKSIEEYDAMTRKSIACPAFPLCGLAQAEAERVMPAFNKRVGALMDKMGLPGESFVMRMTGCPNGCARPYMAEVAFVGQGPDLYQVWLGGSPDQAGRTGWQWIDKMKAADMETTLEVLTLLAYWYKSTNTEGEGAASLYSTCGRRSGRALKRLSETSSSASARTRSMNLRRPMSQALPSATSRSNLDPRPCSWDRLASTLPPPRAASPRAPAHSRFCVFCLSVCVWCVCVRMPVVIRMYLESIHTFTLARSLAPPAPA